VKSALQEAQDKTSASRNEPSTELSRSTYYAALGTCWFSFLRSHLRTCLAGDYLHRGHNLGEFEQVQNENHNRWLQERDWRNVLSFACLYGAILGQPTSKPLLSTASVFNMDVTAVVIDKYDDKQVTFIPYITSQELRAEHHNPKAAVQPEDHRGPPWLFKLVTCFSARGDLLPLLGLITVKDLPADTPLEARRFDIPGFGVTPQTTGYIIVVASTHAEHQVEALDWYFQHVLLSHIDKLITGSSVVDSAAGIQFLVTLDGEACQLKSVLSAAILEQLRTRKIAVMKLMANTSGILQPCDQALCYKLLKRLVHNGLHHTTQNPEFSALIDKIAGMLKGQPETSAWRAETIRKIRRGLEVVGPAISIAFSATYITEIFAKLGWYPFNLELLLARIKELTPRVREACIAAFPSLLEVARYDRLVALLWCHSQRVCFRGSWELPEDAMTVARVPCMGENGKELTEEADLILRDFELKQRAMNRARALIITSPECLDYYKSLRESKSKKGVSSSATTESGETVKKPKLPALKTVSKEVLFLAIVQSNCAQVACCRRR